jgi:hypothetical protein
MRGQGVNMPQLATHPLGQARPMCGSVRVKGAERGPGYSPSAASVSGVVGPDGLLPFLRAASPCP